MYYNSSCCILLFVFRRTFVLVMSSLTFLYFFYLRVIKYQFYLRLVKMQTLSGIQALYFLICVLESFYKLYL